MAKSKKENKNLTFIASRIRAIRESLNLTQKQLARRLNVSGPTLSEFENGNHQPNFEFIYNIHREFYVNLYYLLYGEGEMFEERGGPLSQRLERLCKQNKDVTRLLEYFERSTVIRYYLLSQFKGKMLLEKELIEKEMVEGNEEG
jgi:transcriptional regulator with XRE-family HTH domain